MGREDTIQMSDVTKFLYYICPSCGNRACVIDENGKIICTKMGCMQPTAINDLIVQRIGYHVHAGIQTERNNV